MKSVTLYVVNWNSGALIAKCLQQLNQQTISPARVFVIDNASSDVSFPESELALRRTFCHNSHPSQEFTGFLKDHGIQISMGGTGCGLDNMFIERLWRSIKSEEVQLQAHDSFRAAHQGLGRYLTFFNSSTDRTERLTTRVTAT